MDLKAEMHEPSSPCVWTIWVSLMMSCQLGLYMLTTTHCEPVHYSESTLTPLSLLLSSNRKHNKVQNCAPNSLPWLLIKTLFSKPWDKSRRLKEKKRGQKFQLRWQGYGQATPLTKPAPTGVCDATWALTGNSMQVAQTEIEQGLK